MKNIFMLIFGIVLTGIYVIGTLRFTRNEDPWHRILFNEFCVFAFFGLLGLLFVIVNSLR
jgi:hypothetical protein